MEAGLCKLGPLFDLLNLHVRSDITVDIVSQPIHLLLAVSRAAFNSTRSQVTSVDSSWTIFFNSLTSSWVSLPLTAAGGVFGTRHPLAEQDSQKNWISSIRSICEP